MKHLGELQFSMYDVNILLKIMCIFRVFMYIWQCDWGLVESSEWGAGTQEQYTDMCQTGNSYENGNGNPEPDSARDPQKTKSAPALNLLHTLDVIVQNCMNEAFVK